MIRCQNCGHINVDDAAFCEKCGANLETRFSSRVQGEQIKN